ncbi:family 20 glycosylhydrolase [Streptomyces sp. NPDC005761]|uniref:family 20 glycosylhydrolase n=1 Tax=Streptomyces sp. NPDC005761 TaxID=3157066 RepID=UPI0033D4D923
MVRIFRYWLAALAAAAAAAGTLGVPASAAPARTMEAQGSPAVLPPLQKWVAGDGHFTLKNSSRIVVDRDRSTALLADARTFAADVAELGGAKLPVVRGDAPHPGDIFVTTGSAGAVDGAGEGFRLDVTKNAVTLHGAGPVGTFYAEQAVEQILKTASDHASVPVGTSENAPARRERGLMIDTARKYWSMASIKQLIRQQAWMRLNTLHWHFTDAEFFRLDLPGYPGLAAAESYTPADLREIQDYATRYHVTVLPELDIPGHATAMARYRPALRWACPSMNTMISPGRIDPGFTVDITQPDNVAWLDGLVKEIVKQFDSPVIHLGGDETPQTALQQQCPELGEFAAARGYQKTEDVFLAYENHLNDLLAGLGKRMQIWGWWPQAGGSGSVTVDKAIRIQAWLGDEQTFIDQGYDVVVSDEHSRLYVVPSYAPGSGNGTYIPDGNALYSSYAPPRSDRVLGMELAQWGDRAYTMPDAYMLYYLRRPLQLLASTAWGSPRMANHLDYEAYADSIGTAPGVPEAADPDARPVTGTPVGPAGVEAAFDGDPTTAYAATTAGASVGLDLGADGADGTGGAGGAVQPVAARILPRSNSTADLASLVGSKVQGCTDSPDSGCHTLATVEWTPTRDWLTLPIDGSGRYRWLRFVGAPSAKPVTAEVQFLGTPGPVRLAVEAPATLRPGHDNTVTAVITNPTGRVLPAVEVRLGSHQLLANTALSGMPSARTLAVPAGKSRTVRFQVHPAADVDPGSYRLTATAVPRGDQGLIRATAVSEVPLRSLHQAFDNIAVTDDGNPQPGNIDGALSSYSAGGLAAAGVTAGGQLRSGGFSFALPGRLDGTEDNAIAHGQTVPLSGTTSRVGLLVTGTYAPAGGLTGDITLTYTDGTSSTSRITVPDWGAATPPAGTVVAADGGRVNGQGRTQSSRVARLYTVGVDADADKQLASVSLPAGPRYLQAKAPMIHVFAIATEEEGS